MIFPQKLEKVNFYLPELNAYHELTVFAASTGLSMETFYQREAISGKKTTGIRGFRFNMDMTFDQLVDHDAMTDFLNDLYQEYTSGGDTIRMYLKPRAEIAPQTDYVDVTVADAMANFDYNNTIRKHGYKLSFTGTFVDIGIGLVFLLDNAQIFIFDNSGNRILVALNPL